MAVMSSARCERRDHPSQHVSCVGSGHPFSIRGGHISPHNAVPVFWKRREEPQARRAPRLGTALNVPDAASSATDWQIHATLDGAVGDSGPRRHGRRLGRRCGECSDNRDHHFGRGAHRLDLHGG